MNAPLRTGRSTAALCLTAFSIALASAAPASAQQDTRVFIAVNGGLQALTTNFSQDVVFAESGGPYRDVLSGAAAHERARLESSYRVRSAVLFDLSGGVHLARNVGFGIGVSRFGTNDAASVSARVPHPLYFDRDRSISGRSLPLSRTETAIHLQARLMLPVHESVTVTAFGGPTLFRVEQQLVRDVRFSHEYPYDTAMFVMAIQRPASGSAVAFNLGADVAYYFSPSVGIGWLVRYGRATVELPSIDEGSLRIRAGGLHTAWGLRLRF